MMLICPEEGDVSLQTSNEKSLTCFGEANQLESKFLKVLEYYLLKYFRKKMFLNVERKKNSFSPPLFYISCSFNWKSNILLKGRL